MDAASAKEAQRAATGARRRAKGTERQAYKVAHGMAARGRAPASSRGDRKAGHGSSSGARGSHHKAGGLSDWIADEVREFQA